MRCTTPTLHSALLWKREREKEKGRKIERQTKGERDGAKNLLKKKKKHVLYQKKGKIRFIPGVTMNTRSANCSLGGLSIVYPIPVILILCCQLASAEIYSGFNSKQ